MIGFNSTFPVRIEKYMIFDNYIIADFASKYCKCITNFLLFLLGYQTVLYPLMFIF